MSHYLWSARFITGALTLLLGAALLVGGALYLPWSAQDARYELVLGAAFCLLAPLLALLPRAGLAGYALLFAAALAWSLLQVGLDIWVLLPRLAAPLLWAGVLFTLRHRIAPTHDPYGAALQRIIQGNAS
jgi:glucose dehydrogenase